MDAKLTAPESVESSLSLREAAAVLRSADESGGPVRRALRVVGAPLGTVAVIVGILEFVHRAGVFHELVWPSPFTVIEELGRLVVTGYMWSHLRVTVQEAFIGFAIGSSVGFLLGTGIGLSRRFAQAWYPYVVLIQSTPRVVLAPLFVAMFGFGMTSRIVAAIAVCFFPTLINTVIGFREADKDAISLMSSLCASRWQTFRKLLLPGALPSIFGGLRTSMTLAYIGAVVAEFSGGRTGVGNLIRISAQQLRMASVFGYLVLLGLASLISFMALGLIERKAVFWKT